MSYISRSQWIRAKLETLSNGKEEKLSMLLYPSEYRRVVKRYPELKVVISEKAKTDLNDKRITCEISK